MKFISFLILIFLFTSPLLSATAKYIKVTNTTSKKQLRAIKSKLNSMGLRMIYKTTKSKYLVYSGPYKGMRSSRYALSKMRRYFPNAKILNIKKTKRTSIIKTPLRDKDFFIGGSLGYSSAPSTHSLEIGSVSPYEPKNSGLSYGVDGGYAFKDDFSFALGYTRFDTSDIVFDNIYGALNYRFVKYNNFSPYFGILAGLSSLQWNVDPISDIEKDASNNDSTSLFWGSSAGLVYDGFSFLSLYMGYQCIFMNHTTNIELDTTNKSKLQHNTLHTLQIGIQYNF